MQKKEGNPYAPPTSAETAVTPYVDNVFLSIARISTGITLGAIAIGFATQTLSFAIAMSYVLVASVVVYHAFYHACDLAFTRQRPFVAFAFALGLLLLHVPLTAFHTVTQLLLFGEWRHENDVAEYAFFLASMSVLCAFVAFRLTNPKSS